MRKMYVGVKSIMAEPMTRGEYNKVRGWQLPANEEPDDPGYLVEYENGHISWSPADVFNESYQENGKLTFSAALALIKAGKQVARAGWNGKDQFVYLLQGSKMATRAGYGFGEYIGEPTFGDLLVIRNSQNMLFSWVPSMGDLMASDWVVL